jgi:hypothetical protein
MKYYVVPSSGSMSNSGTSLAKPWSTLQAVFGAGKRFAPGDEILVARGHHGAVVITGNYAVGPRTRSARAATTAPLAGAGAGAAAAPAAAEPPAATVEAEEEAAALDTAEALAVEAEAAAAAAGAPAVAPVEDLAEDTPAATGSAGAPVADPAGLAPRAAIAPAAATFPLPLPSTVVTIKPLDATHAPVVSTLTLVAAARWVVCGLAVVPRLGPLAPGIPPASAAALAASGVRAPRGITLSSQAAEDVEDCVLVGCALYSAQSTAGWTPTQWLSANASGGIHVFGRRNALVDCHSLNGAGIYFNFHTTGCGAYGCTAENFCTDGMNIKGNSVTVRGCVIMGSHKVNNNHNDLCQAWTSSDVVFDGNALVAYVDPAQPYKATDAQGLGAFDGWKVRWAVTNCRVAVDHPIGMWFQGEQDLYVAHNTVTRCGATAWNPRRPPSILLGPSKSGAIKGGSTVANNLVEALELAAGYPVTKVGNVVLTGSTLPTSVWVDRPRDMHLKRTATKARGAGVAAAVKPPADVDADGVPRVPAAGAPPGTPVDAGAYQYTVAGAVTPVPPPARPVTTVVPVPGLGVNVAWTKASPAEKCVEVLADGVRVAKVRTGATAWMVVGVPLPSPLPVYTVRAIGAVSV